MKLKIGTRKSDLALKQTDLISKALNLLGIETEVVASDSVVDLREDRKVYDKKEWILKLEQALVDHEIDLAVHSAKDVPSDIDPLTTVQSALVRANPCDVFIGKAGIKVSQLQAGGSVASSSLRRQAYIKKILNMQAVEIRGNVPTRISKLDQSNNLSGIILAAAGLERLNLLKAEYEIINMKDLTPAANQGIICIQYLKDEKISKILQNLVDYKTEQEFQAERMMIKLLKADCNSALGIFAEVVNQEITITADIFSRTSSERILAKVTGLVDNLNKLSEELYLNLARQGGLDLL